MHGSLVEVRELAIRDLSVGVQRQDGTGMVSCISDKVTTDEVVASLWKSHYCRELLIKVVRDGLEGDDAFSQDDSSLLDGKNRVHIPCDVELMQTFDVGVLSVLHIGLSLLELLSQLDTGMGEHDSLEVH